MPMPMEVELTRSLSETAPSSQVLHLGAHGSQVVDTTVLAGGVVGIVVRLSGESNTIVGVAHSLDHQLVLRVGRGRSLAYSYQDVLKELPNKSARDVFDIGLEVLTLRHKLSNA